MIASRSDYVCRSLHLAGSVQTQRLPWTSVLHLTEEVVEDGGKVFSRSFIEV